MGEVFDDCMDATVDALVGKEASVKDDMRVGHYATHPDVGGPKADNSVVAALVDVGELRRKYDALLSLARRLRYELNQAKAYPTREMLSVLHDSKWLKE